jgi:hypothetical protein
MKTKFLFLLFFISSYGFSQSVNDYAAVIIPLKYDFLKSENQYRLTTLTKFNLQKSGFVGFYTNEIIPTQYNDRCSLLYIDVVKENAFLATKLFVTFKDCYGKIIFQSEVGKSKEKEFEVAYAEALNIAFQSIMALHYKFTGTIKTFVQPVVTSPIVTTATVATVATTVASDVTADQNDVLFAQPIKNGFQLVDSTPKVVMKVYKTTNPSIYIASKENLQGVMIQKEGQWFFEFYQKDTLMSEKISVKF